MKMKHIKFISAIAGTLLISSSLLMGCGNKTTTSSKTDSLKKVKLNEVVRSVFYAPMYASINKGYFKDFGLDIELSTGQGADAHMIKTQVLLLIGWI